MGMLIAGKWETDPPPNTDSKGRFMRQQTVYRNWITADGADGLKAEAGRYHLYVSLACPWAHRTLIMRKLKGLEQAISLSVVDHFMGAEGWRFNDSPGAIPDSVNGAGLLQEVYLAADPSYTGRVSVPVLWDKASGTIVNNESVEIMRMMDTAFDAVGSAMDGAIDRVEASYYPAHLAEQVDKIIGENYHAINNGVYRAGFAQTQMAHEEAVRELFAALDRWEDILERQRYLAGEVITEADWCLFTTLIRFDMVYFTHFKCNLRRIRDYPNLWNYLRELYQLPGVAETCNFDHIKQHYFRSHSSLNPLGIVPLGPADLDFSEPHDRAKKFAA